MQDSSLKDSWGTKGELVAPKATDLHPEIQKRFACEFSKTPLKYHVVRLREESVLIQLYIGDSMRLGGVYLSTVEHNCSAVHISHLEAHIQGIGKHILKAVEDWCIYAGYTIILGNTAGNQNDYALPFFLKHGYKKFGESYKNHRSRNENIWICKMLPNVNENNDEDEENEEDYLDNEDFDD
jgi:GNAT superfamily N-acetyltransferase